MHVDELIEKSLHTLELHKILELLVAQAVTEEGKQRAAALRPSSDQREVAHWLGESAAAVFLINGKGTPAFSGVRPVGSALQRAEMGGVLNTRELLGIAAVLRATRAAKEYGDGQEEKTVIDHLFYALRPDRNLEERISGSIVGEDEIADSASAELAGIRRHIRAASGKVRDILQKLISSPQAKYLQEALITMRSGRYVVPVKSEYKNEIPGLVHDVSGSGSTFFVEPMAVVKANNELKEILAREEAEIERILAELSALVAAQKDEILENYQHLIFLDLIFAKGKLALQMKATAPALSERNIFLKAARHPLLEAKTAVANDLILGGEFDTLVITGPNTGGKTVTLKTLGLLTLMAQCGLHIPAEEGSCVAVCSRVWADIGDEQSIAQSLSTFSSHMSNIVKILAETDERSLILFDELGAGTDPVEGAALAAAIIEHARELGALVAATTHYAELKVYAMSTKGVQNASCEFDVETLAPTYRLIIGIPGKSNAFAISQRLGLPAAIIQKAAERIDAEQVRFEDVLTRLDEQRQEMERERAAAAALRLEMQTAARKAERYQKEVEAEREAAVQKARAEAQWMIDEARGAADAVFAELKTLRREQERQVDWQESNEARTELRRRLNEAEAKLGARKEAEAPPMIRPARPGDTVELLKMGVQASVLSENKDGTLQLQAGILRVTAKQEELRVVEGESQGQKEAKRHIQRTEAKLRSLGASKEVDLRGLTTYEAEHALLQFLDQALLGNLSQITVIHGKGTGAVRKTVHEQLRRTRQVKSFRLGRYGEGEDGVTVVELK